MRISQYHYKVGIESLSIRGIDGSRPWNLETIISDNCDSNKILLDIGCGTAFKLIQFSDKVKFIIGLEPNTALLSKANENMLAHQVSNAIFVHGYAESLPFPDNQFDIITVMLAPFSAAEIHRVLKPGGVAILEKVGDHDKKALKSFFGKDKEGWRGYLYTEDDETPQKNAIESDFNKFFTDFSIQDGTWKTYYTLEGLLQLLEESPTVRNFNRETDQLMLDAAIDSLKTEKGIEITQNRLLIVAKK